MNVPYWKLTYLGSDLKPMLELGFPNKVTGILKKYGTLKKENSRGNLLKSKY